MFVGEAGCWLVVLGQYLYKRFALSKVKYQPLLADDSSTHRDSSLDDVREAHGQGITDPTNIVAKPLVAPEILGNKERVPLEGGKVLLLAIPACCDIAGTTLMNVGLLFVAASIYQMTRGALVLFVAVLSVLVLKRRIGAWHWVSVFIVVSGVALVGLAGALDKQSGTEDNGKLPEDKEYRKRAMSFAIHASRAAVHEIKAMAQDHSALQTIVGVILIAVAQVFSASQFVTEEALMERYSIESLQVVGWEGIFGFAVTAAVMAIMFVAVGRTDAGRGGYFDVREGFYEVFHYRAIGLSSLLIMISIGSFNFFGISVTRSISATSRSTIDTCRTLFIWIVSLGLGWETFKWLQVVGFALLVYGTGMYNDIIGPPRLAWMFRRRNEEGQEEGDGEIRVSDER
ncbi:hypothetical protein LTR66_009955 [Elasticomyces elasticus]|nr:hypothetical protein LTR66_009955 [Elasticomyces elasticus]KAK4986218.1 hypothetical protein LTR50_005447 [Elasticomyces elasticus]